MNVVLSRRGTLGVVSVALVAVLLGAAVAGAERETLVSEWMLPADAFVAAFIRNGDATVESWKSTALYEVLQMPETKEMMAPLLESIKKAASFTGPLPTPPSSLLELLKGEVGLAVAVKMTPEGPMPLVQVVLLPAEPQKAKDLIDKWIAAAVEMGIAELAPSDEGTMVLNLEEELCLAYSFEGETAVLTLSAQNDADSHLVAWSFSGRRGREYTVLWRRLQRRDGSHRHSCSPNRGDL